jgi:hypothetical protein
MSTKAGTRASTSSMATVSCAHPISYNSSFRRDESAKKHSCKAGVELGLCFHLAPRTILYYRHIDNKHLLEDVSDVTNVSQVRN